MDQSSVGKIGTVVRAVRGGGMPGEVRIVDAGEPMLIMAYCEQPLEVGSKVRVLRSRGSRQVDVAPWP